MWHKYGLLSTCHRYEQEVCAANGRMLRGCYCPQEMMIRKGAAGAEAADQATEMTTVADPFLGQTGSSTDHSRQESTDSGLGELPSVLKSVRCCFNVWCFWSLSRSSILSICWIWGCAFSSVCVPCVYSCPRWVLLLVTQVFVVVCVMSYEK